MSTQRLNARIFAVGGIVVGQLGVLTVVLNAGLASHNAGWAWATEVACFLAAAVLGLTTPRSWAGGTGTGASSAASEDIVAVPRVPQTLAG